MASEAEVNRFFAKVLGTLFQGEPLYPYRIIFDEWAHYRQFLVAHGISELGIPVLTKTTPRPAVHVQIKENDFLIQVIVAYVLREVSVGMKRVGIKRLTGTELRAVKTFLSISDEYLPIRRGTGKKRSDIYLADSFEKLTDKIQGDHAQILNWACQRLSFFYRRQIEKEAREEEVQRRKAAEQPPKPSTETRANTAPAPSSNTQEVILKEEFVDRLYNAVTHHPELKKMIHQVNLELKADQEKVDIKLDNEGKGLFSVGQAQVDLRNILVRIFVAIKPEAELLLSFLVSKIQPDKVNLIEMHYENGLAEFEVSMMLTDGGISKEIHGAITDCSAKTTFPKIVLVCAHILEEVLGKKVNISFNRKGEVVVELPEIKEKNFKNLAGVLSKKLEEAILKNNRKAMRKSDPLSEDLKQIGLQLEQEENRTPRPVNETVYLPDQYDEMINADLMETGKTLEQKRAVAPVAAGETGQKEELSSLEQQFYDYQRRIAADHTGIQPLPEESSARAHTPADGHWGQHDRDDVHPVDDDEHGPPSEAEDGNDYTDRMERLEASFHQTKPSEGSQQFVEQLLGGNKLAERKSDYQHAARATGASIDDLLPFERKAMYRAPREVTMAILSRVRSKSQHDRNRSGYSEANADRQLALNFLDVLDEVAFECCGRRLGTLFPDLVGVDNFYIIAKKLNEISDKQQHHPMRTDMFEILISGALLASSSIQLTNR